MNIRIAPLSDMPANTRTVLLIGSRSSDHLQELLRIAETKGRAAYRIETASELQPRWFAGQDDVGIVLGAAGLEPTLAAVIEKLNQFAAADSRGMLEGLAQ